MHIEQQISAALAGRASQHDFVENLADRWNGLTASFNALVSSTGKLTRAATTARAPDSTRAAVFDSIRDFGIGGDWQQKAAALSAELGEGADRIDVLRSRIDRETVNIGVIGVTGAGKSTLLRKLSGLAEDHIPSNRFASSTATPSRIFHDSGSGGGRAVLNLHTWPTFREEVLQPLHEKAGLPEPAPANIEEFRRFRYPETIPDQQAGSERFTRRLRAARDSLASYESMLRGGTELITLDRLRPFVAYPPDDYSHERPYHAVRSVDIFCRFPEMGMVRLGLVDLPGSGEAGLDVHKRFLTDLRNNTDLLFIVRRPVKSPSTEQDWDAAQLADDAAAGVRRGDFAHLVINRDVDLSQEYFDTALDRAQGDSSKFGIEIRVCDIENSEPPQVIEAILEPVLKHLATRLAVMDRDAVAFVLTGLSGLAAKVRTLCGELDRKFGDWQDKLPDEEIERRRRIRELKYQIGWNLDQVRNEYDRLFESETPISELNQQVEEAGREIRQWLAAGLGTGTREKWIEAFQKAMAGKGMGDELDRQYNGARKKVVGVFDKIDASLELAINRLYGEVAAALQAKLTDKLVPDGKGNAPLSEFLATAQSHKAGTLASATDRLLMLRADYGSIFLRVGRPVVRRIEWYSDGQQPAAGLQSTAASAAAGLTGQAAGAAAPATGRAIGHALGGPAGEALGHLVGEAVASNIRQRTGQAATGQGSWLSDHVPSPATRQPAPVAPSAAGPAQPARPPAATPAGSASGGEQYPDAARWYDRLTATIEDVTGELEREFRAEAQRAQRVLAAAVDLYKDSATTAPDIDVEFDRLSSLAQREIWPHEFSEDSAGITADMAALREQGHVTEAACDQLKSLVNEAVKL